MNSRSFIKVNFDGSREPATGFEGSIAFSLDSVELTDANLTPTSSNVFRADFDTNLTHQKRGTTGVWLFESAWCV